MALYRLCFLVSAILAVAYTQDVCPASSCKSGDVALLDAGQNGATDHFYIGGLFGVREEGEDPYSCGNIRLRGLVNSEAFFWAIKTYQDRAGLSNADDPVTVGGFVMDSCSRTEKVVENIYSFETCRTQFAGVSPRNTVAYVGPDRSGDALETATLLRDMERAHILSAATSPMLSNPMFNYTLRIVPSDAVEVQVMSSLLQYKSILKVQVVYLDNPYGHGLYMAFKEQAEAKGICIVGMAKIAPNNVNDVLTLLLENTVTKYIVLLADNAGARRVLEAVDADSRIRNQFAFVGTSSWGQDMSVIKDLAATENSITLSLDSDSYFNNADVLQFWNAFFQLEPNTGSNTGPNVNTHNPYFSQFWEETFGCNLDLGNCDLANQNLRDKMNGIDTYVPYTMMAVDAVIRGIKSAAELYCNGIHLCSEMLNRDRSRGLTLIDGIRNAQNSGRSYFNTNSQDSVNYGEVSNLFQKYKIYQVKGEEYKNVLDYDSARMNINNGFISDGKPAMVMLTSGCKNNPCLECGEAPLTQPTTAAQTTTAAPLTSSTLSEEIRLMLISRFFKSDQEFTGIWRDQERESEDSKTRFEKGHDWIIALGVVAGLGVLCVFVFEIYILYKLTGTKIGRQWRTMWLGQLLLLGIFLCFLTLFAFLPTPTKATCGITRFGVGVSYAICFAVLLVKLMVLLTSKTSSEALLPGDVDSPNYLRGIYQFLMFLFVVGVQVVIAVQWLIMVPPDAIQVTSNNGDKVWICNHYTWSLDQGWEDMPYFVRTNFENHLISLTYIMFLIVLTAIVAMRAHGIITNHRESVFIGIAAGFTIPVWIAWGLVGGLNKDHAYAQEFGDACLAFGLAITAALLLFSMFLPKVRQLVNMGVEGIYLEDDRDTYYAGSVIMAPPSYKSRPSSVVYVNNSGYNDPVVIGDPNAMHLKHPGSTYSAPVYVKRPDSIGHASGKVLKMTGDLTGKHPRESKRSTTSEAGYAYAGSGYGGTYRKSRSESGTLRKAHSTQNLGAL